MEFLTNVQNNSISKKRKVGVICLNFRFEINSIGYNYSCPKNLFSGNELEDSFGNTKNSVIHAEESVILNCLRRNLKPKYLISTCLPCEHCIALLQASYLPIEYIFFQEFGTSNLKKIDDRINYIESMQFKLIKLDN